MKPTPEKNFGNIQGTIQRSRLHTAPRKEDSKPRFPGELGHALEPSPSPAVDEREKILGVRAEQCLATKTKAVGGPPRIKPWPRLKVNIFASFPLCGPSLGGRTLCRQWHIISPRPCASTLIPGIPLAFLFLNPWTICLTSSISKALLLPQLSAHLLSLMPSMCLWGSMGEPQGYSKWMGAFCMEHLFAKYFYRF